jgi:L-alanine-DL-glutamate epimerase-like enolase superfamily enzyme
VKIESIDILPARYPLSGYFKFFEGSPGHRVLFVKATADDGTVGWGQSLPVPTWSYETPETALVALRDYLAPALIGRDPLDIEGAHRAMDRALAPAWTTGMPIARAGLDIALHDLAGKLKGQSFAEMWGRAPGGPVRLGWTINVRSLEELDAQIEAAFGRGYRHFNVKIGPDPRFDVEVARRIRARAPESFLWADANAGYDLATTLQLAPKLADAGVDVLESPLRPNRISGYQALKKQGALPVTMDEGVISPVEAEEFIRLEMVDGLTIKVSRAGGLLSAKRQIELVLDAGLFWLGSGLTDPDVSLAASLALYGTFNLDKPAALNGPQFLTADVLAEPLAIEQDVAQVPRAPGLGVEVDPAKVRQLMGPEARAS